MSEHMALVCTGCGEIMDPGVKMTAAKVAHQECGGRITTELVGA